MANQNPNQNNQQAINEKEQSTRFEALISDLSVRFINVSSEQVDAEIERGLKKIQTFFEADRAALTQFSPDKSGIQLIQSVFAVKGDKLPEQIEVKKRFPWSTAKTLRGEAICFSTLKDLPAEANIDKTNYRSLQVTSLLSVPLFVEGEVQYSISIVMTEQERVWPETFLPLLRVVGEIFVNALLRQQIEKVRRQSEETLKVILDNIPAYISFVGRDCRYKFVNKQYAIGFQKTLEEIEGKHLKEVIGEEMFESLKQDLEDVFSGKPVTRENKLTNVPDAPRYSLVKAVPARNQQEEIIGYYGLAIDITDLKKTQEKLQQANEEIRQLNKKLKNENIYLRDEIKIHHQFEGIVGESEAIQKVLYQVEQVAGTNSTVLLLGETGVGKELIARAIHDKSSRKDRALVKVNCGALPSTLVESELFGREKGAYTGALSKQIGRFEIADGSTIFLDEIGELPLELQVKLLRVLQEGEFERLGGSGTIKVNVRVIAATNRDLEKAIQEGKFREDLYYRLKVFPITVPPLRDRPEDVPLLVWAFVKEIGRAMGKQIESIPKKTLEVLQRYPWPGNIRELRNMIEHSMIISQGKTLQVQLPETVNNAGVLNLTLEETERRHILAVLERTGWHVKGKNGAAEILGLHPATLNSRMKKLGITRP
jgi:PAS domain S-box-containing protein